MAANDGMDCTLLPDSRVPFFEANATMLVHQADAAGTIAYKTQHVQPILDAMARLLVHRKAG